MPNAVFMLSPGPIEKFMAEDHARIDRLLADAQQADKTVNDAAYALFRGALLRHIAMEEKVLLPFAREVRGGVVLPVAARLREEHGRIAKLLVRTPTVAILDTLRAVLGEHNTIEEGPHGLYGTCDALAGERAPEIVARLRQQPAVPLAPYYDGPPHRRHENATRLRRT